MSRSPEPVPPGSRWTILSPIGRFIEVGLDDEGHPFVGFTDNPHPDTPGFDPDQDQGAIPDAARKEPI